MSSENPVLQSLSDPAELEHLYRSDPRQFEAWLADAVRMEPESETLRVWDARLSYRTPAKADSAGGAAAWRVVMIALGAALLAHGDAIPGVNDEWFVRFRPWIVVGSLIAYFSWSLPRRRKAFVWIGAAACAAMIAVLPVDRNATSVATAQLYLPLVMISLLGVAFMGERWRTSSSRVLFVRYCGELVVYASVILLGGMVLTAVTLSLLEAMGILQTSWYFDWVVISGLIAAPVVGTFIYDSALGRESRIATVLSKVFAPLFLVTVCGYLAAMVMEGTSPYSDRNSLIAANCLLIVVLAIVIYAICGRERRSRFQDVVNVGLVLVTLIINGTALSAIVLRWAEFGMTPNRVAVTGTNLLIFVHLALILISYWRTMTGRAGEDVLIEQVTRYLPLYTAWSALMGFGLSLVFGFA